MLTLARYTLKGPYQAAAIVAALAVFAVVIAKMLPNTFAGAVLASLSLLMSCILVGLIILTQGSAAGLRAIGVSVAGITILSWILINRPELGLWTALVQWLPIILLAQTWRSTQSLAVALLAGVVLGAIAIAAQYLVWPDLERQWVEGALASMQQMQGLDEKIVEANVLFVRQMVLVLVASAFIVFVVLLLMARWLQARLADSHGFQREFHALELGKGPAAAAFVITLSSFWLQQAWLGSLALLVVCAFMFQGIAVVHAKLAERKSGNLVLGFFYFLLVIGGQITVPLTALTGIIDNWVGFRKKQTA